MLATTLLLGGSVAYFGRDYFTQKENPQKANLENMELESINLSSSGAFCPNALKIGAMRNLKSSHCVDISFFDGAGNVGTHACDGFPDQELILCGDGTIRNSARNFCFKAVGGNVVSEHCNLLTGP